MGVLLTFKSLHQQAPVYLRELLKVKGCGSYNLRSNNSLLLTLPPAKSYTTLGDRAFMYAASKLWNALLEQIAMALAFKFLRPKLKHIYLILIDRRSARGGEFEVCGAASLSCFIQICLTHIYLIFTRYVKM